MKDVVTKSSLRLSVEQTRFSTCLGTLWRLHMCISLSSVTHYNGACVILFVDIEYLQLQFSPVQWSEGKGETRALACTSQGRSCLRGRKDGREQISAQSFLFSSSWRPAGVYQGSSGPVGAPGQRDPSLPSGRPRDHTVGLSGSETGTRNHPGDFPPETSCHPPGPSPCPPAGRCSDRPPTWSGAPPRVFYPSVSWPVCTSHPWSGLPTAACISHSGSRPEIQM